DAGGVCELGGSRVGPNMRTRVQKAAALRNLSRRLPKPALGRGCVQRACRRVLWTYGECSTSQVIAWAYARQLLIGGERRRNGFNRAVRRSLAAIGAIRVGRAQTIGRPVLWRLKDS